MAQSIGEGMSLSDTYEVPYSEYFEPYVIMASERFIPYDERFRGYGLNKCIHLRSLARRGDTFHVVVGHFAVASSHDKSAAHAQTYGPSAGYRKHVVAGLYRQAARDQQRRLPAMVSQRTAKLLRYNGNADAMP